MKAQARNSQIAQADGDDDVSWLQTLLSLQLQNRGGPMQLLSS